MAINDQGATVPANMLSGLNPSYILLNKFNVAGYIDQLGTYKPFDERVVIAHEIFHYLTGLHDPSSNTEDAGRNDFSNHDYLIGPAVSFETNVSSDLGLTSHRSDYFDAVHYNDVNYNTIYNNGDSWTFGSHVDVVRLGGYQVVSPGPSPTISPDNDINYSGWGTESILALGLHGDDSIVGSSGNDWLYGNGGADTIWGGEGNDHIHGSSFNALDSLTDGANDLSGEGGDDVIVAGEVGDYLSGGSGEDTLRGGSGDDNIFGNADNDLIFGWGGLDNIFGGDGDDRIVLSKPGFGQEVASGVELEGGAGADTVFLGTVTDRTIASAIDYTYYFRDGDNLDSIVWNGYKLTGGAFTVLVEQTHPEVYNGLTGWIDNHGILYDYSEGNKLSILLPDNSHIEIDSFNNGEWGLSFDAMHAPWDLDGVPRAPTSGLGVPYGGPELFWSNLDMLDGRLAAATTAGAIETPSFTFA